VDNPSDRGASLPLGFGEDLVREMAEERNPLEMTEEEIAEAHGELPPERRAMSVGREVDPLSQPTAFDEIPASSPEDPPPAS
jgi:hypothetical protein